MIALVLSIEPSLFWEAMRWLTALISVVSAALWIATCMELHDGLHQRLQRAWPWVAVLLLVLTYAAVEAALAGVPGGLRTLLIPLSLAGLAGSLHLGIRADRKD